MPNDLLGKVSFLLHPCVSPELTMPSSPVSYSQYYMTPTQQQSSYSSQPITLHHPHEHAMAHHQHHQQHMQAPPSPSIPIDPALALYPPTYYYQQQPPQQHMSHQHLSLPANSMSPDSQGSESIGTPPIEPMSFPGGSNSNGKRPSSSMANSDGRKKVKRDDGADASSPAGDKQDDVKAKPTRGSRCVT